MPGEGGLETDTDNLFIMQLEKAFNSEKSTHGSGTGSRVMSVLDPWRDRYDGDW